ncbi:MAG TPA: ATP-binding protein [Candidatus Tectomicrobia bacterium]|nr:ATP-binding protein [Candidatus Tectomicrobia bacterium]
MLARRLTTILPDITVPEILRTTRIHHVAGITGDCTALIMIRPFRRRIVPSPGSVRRPQLLRSPLVCAGRMLTLHVRIVPP